MSERLKSAYELAMERLRTSDREAGVEERKPLTDRQKQAIAEARQEAQAKRAELKILRGKRLAECAGDPEKLQQEEEHHETDLRRIDAWLDSRIAEIKRD